MTRISIEATKRVVPYIAVYMLGVATFWVGWAMFGEPRKEGPPYQQLARDSAVALPPTVVDLRPSTAEETLAERLAEAARAGNRETVRRLIAEKVDIDARDDRGRTALILAAAAGANGTAELLIRNGADIDATDASGQTALMAAARAGKAKTVRFLLDRDADTKIKARDGATAHDLSIRHKHDAVARLIAAEIDRRNRERVMVTRAQFLLTKLGYQPGAIDGDMGPRTRQSIVEFQKNQDMITDGRVSAALLTALEGRHDALANNQVAKRPAAAPDAVKRRNEASRKAFQRASARGKSVSRRREDEKKSKGGWFSRATRWLGGGDSRQGPDPSSGSSHD